MQTIFVRYNEYAKKIAGIDDNEIDLWWSEIIKLMPENLRIEAKNLGYSLKKDENFDSKSTLGEKFRLSALNSDELNQFLNDKGPFYIIVGAT